MTGLNVEFRIPGDSFVADQIDSLLTANPPDFAAGVTRTFSTTHSGQLRPAKP
jgi:hypothetical protein